jgi:hypothetical protein
MRIIIEVEDDKLTAATEGQREANRSPEPPPELLRTAAALGATSAGPAPSPEEVTGVRVEELAPEATEALSATQVDAGGAPFGPSTAAEPTTAYAEEEGLSASEGSKR